MCRARVPIIMIGVLLFAVLSNGVGWADGGFFIDLLATETQAEAAADGLLSSSGQRAVLWRTDDSCWDLYVEPGTVQMDDAAWVMPLPVTPEVNEASAVFIDQIDAATIPTFTTIVEYYQESSDSGGCIGCNMDSGGAGVGDEQEDPQVDDGVTVWGQGRLGDLEYEVVSTTTATALQDWLTTNDYVVPDDLATSIEPYVTDSYYFFVAKVDRQDGDATNVSVVRFTLCDTDTENLWYPVQLSAYSIATTLDFTLFIVDSDAYYEPIYCSWDVPGNFYNSYRVYYGETEYNEGRSDIEGGFKDDYDSRIDTIVQASSGRSLALQFASEIDPVDLSTRIGQLEQAGITSPLAANEGNWTSELSLIVDGNLRVTRFVGSFPTSAMEMDLEFSPSATIEVDNAMYERIISVYNVPPPDSAGGDVGGGDDMDAVGRWQTQSHFSQASMFMCARSHRLRFLIGLFFVGAFVWWRRS